MAAQEQAMKPILQKPPGFRDPSKPVPRPPPPLRKAALPPSFQPRKRRKNYGGMCCRILVIISFTVLLILFILGGVFYLWFDPKLPVFHLQSFKISSFRVTTKPDGTYLNAATVARVEVRNPNSKLTYRYSESQVQMTLGQDQGTQLGSMSLPGFLQDKKNTTSFKIQMSVKNELIEDGVGSRLKSQFKSRKLVVNVQVTTKVGVDVQGLEIGMLGVDVSCDGITLKQIDGDDMPKCSIHTLKWININ
ncbi:uncharacterized protein LOC8286723 isoform X2 [Ricinus communis]|uniref:uncharacterized protein LOC8286723 isoform X2 n=1 Tax=Ricinus communis TaxID=3988 RepID=UPI0007729197|nr:uncharacterized protein LOC8286723 isoform X2 [Ricinus communis]|eukprot:XP_002511957.2 uncharacterized protein LOC8286723 [Ricinus communis]